MILKQFYELSYDLQASPLLVKPFFKLNFQKKNRKLQFCSLFFEKITNIHFAIEESASGSKRLQVALKIMEFLQVTWKVGKLKCLSKQN